MCHCDNLGANKHNPPPTQETNITGSGRHFNIGEDMGDNKMYPPIPIL